MTLQERWRRVTCTALRSQLQARPEEPAPGSVPGPRMPPPGTGPSRWPSGAPTRSAGCHSPLSQGNGMPMPGAWSKLRRRRNRTAGDEGPGSGPTKAPGQPGAGMPAGPAPPQGARARGSRFRGGPPPSLLSNQQPLPASFPANPHTPRRIALGGVWEGA